MLLESLFCAMDVINLNWANGDLGDSKEYGKFHEMIFYPVTSYYYLKKLPRILFQEMPKKIITTREAEETLNHLSTNISYHAMNCIENLIMCNKRVVSLLLYLEEEDKAKKFFSLLFDIWFLDPNVFTHINYIKRKVVNFMGTLLETTSFSFKGQILMINMA